MVGGGSKYNLPTSMHLLPHVVEVGVAGRPTLFSPAPLVVTGCNDGGGGSSNRIILATKKPYPATCKDLEPDVSSRGPPVCKRSSLGSPRPSPPSRALCEDQGCTVHVGGMQRF